MPVVFKEFDYPENLQDGMSVPCPCPEHTHNDQSPSGVWREPRGKTLDYGVWCFKAQKFYTLNELFHFRHSGNLIKLRAEIDPYGTRREHRRTFLLWGLRCLDGARLMMIPKQWGYPMLPANAPEDSRTLWQVILDVKRFRNATEQGGHEHLPLSYRFLRDWSPSVRDWAHDRFQKAFTWLVSKSFLRKVGEYGKGIYKTALWIIGRREQRQACKDAPVERTIEKAVESVDAIPLPEPIEVDRIPESIELDRTSACPYADIREPGFDSRHCEHCLQAFLDNRRAQLGIWIDPRDPYGRGTLALSPI